MYYYSCFIERKLKYIQREEVTFITSINIPLVKASPMAEPKVKGSKVDCLVERTSKLQWYRIGVQRGGEFRPVIYYILP